MRIIKYIARQVTYLLVTLMLSIFKIFFRLGIFKELSQKFISSCDLGYGGSQYKNQNYGEAYKTFKKYERRDNDYCHGIIKYHLALMYFHGHGVPGDRDAAEIYFIQSASLGDDLAKDYLERKSQNEQGH